MDFFLESFDDSLHLDFLNIFCWSLLISLLCTVGKLAGGGFVAVAVAVVIGDR